MPVGARTQAPALPDAPARLSRRAASAPAGGPGRVLALQRMAGNAAVARLVEERRRTLQRACCAGCADGHSCESEELLADLEA